MQNKTSSKSHFQAVHYLYKWLPGWGIIIYMSSLWGLNSKYTTRKENDAAGQIVMLALPLEQSRLEGFGCSFEEMFSLPSLMVIYVRGAADWLVGCDVNP